MPKFDNKKKDRKPRVDEKGQRDPNMPQSITKVNCKACQSEWRPYIDAMLARGYSVRAISDKVNEAGENLHYTTIHRHKKHLDLDRGAYRQIAEKYAKELQEARAGHELRVVGGQAWLDMFIQKAWDKVLQDDFEFTPGDAIKAIQLRDQMDKDGADELRDTMTRQLQAIILAIKDVVPEEYQPQLAARAKEIASDPDMFNSLAPAPIEAEVVEELPEGEIDGD